MDNIIYRAQLNGSNRLELSHYNDANDQHIGVTIYGDFLQFDGSLNEREIDSLIKYLQDIRESVNKKYTRP